MKGLGGNSGAFFMRVFDPVETCPAGSFQTKRRLGIFIKKRRSGAALMGLTVLLSAGVSPGTCARVRAFVKPVSHGRPFRGSRECQVVVSRHGSDPSRSKAFVAAGMPESGLTIG
jgi:hypothetical protein